MHLAGDGDSRLDDRRGCGLVPVYPLDRRARCPQLDRGCLVLRDRLQGHESAAGTEPTE